MSRAATSAAIDAVDDLTAAAIRRHGTVLAMLQEQQAEQLALLRRLVLAVEDIGARLGRIERALGVEGVDVEG